MLNTLRRLFKRGQRRFSVRRDLNALVKCPVDDVDQYTTGYATCEDRSIVVHIYRVIDQEVVGQECQLLDLSSTGAKLFVSSKFALGEAVGLRIQFEEMDIDVTEAATVCWTGFRGEGNWMVGCALAQDLPEDAFQAIVDSGYLERRGQLRKEIEVHAIVRKATSPGTAVEVRLDDYSVGGFGMFVQEPMEIGESICLQSTADKKSPIEIPAVVRWQKKTKFGYTVGCSFAEETGHGKFEHAICQFRVEFSAHEDAARENSAHHTTKRWAFFAAGVVMFVAGLLLMFLGR